MLEGRQLSRAGQSVYFLHKCPHVMEKALINLIIFRFVETGNKGQQLVPH